MSCSRSGQILRQRLRMTFLETPGLAGTAPTCHSEERLRRGILRRFGMRHDPSTFRPDPSPKAQDDIFRKARVVMNSANLSFRGAVATRNLALIEDEA